MGRMPMGKFQDLTGQRFGRLTVIERAENYYTSGGNSKVMWQCHCDCGNDPKVSAGDLRKGTKSCGCYSAEIAGKRMKALRHKTNEYDLSNEYGMGYTSASHEPFYFDKEDYDLIKDYCWNKHHSNYIFANYTFPDGKRKKIYLHKLVMHCEFAGRSKMVDHISGHHEDCRKANLRYATAKQNNQNHGIPKNNTSGKCGLQWREEKKVWEVYIGVDKKRKYLGSSHDYDTAVKIREDGEKKYFGEWARKENDIHMEV